MNKLLPFLLFIAINITAQNIYRSPLDIPLVLSANFGELRPNHFHSGIDLKTQGVENKPVYSIADGYISRISVSPSGYGLAIYVNHPNGQTSVYGHVNKFAPKFAEYVKEKQYEEESYKIDLTIDNSVFPVKKGDLIAYSGNTGSSGGPHVHFEIRNTTDQMALDALEYYKGQIKDSEPPVVKGIAVYPIGNEGVVNNNTEPFRRIVAVTQKGGYAPLKDSIKAWGKIGVGVYTNDRMTGTSNIYGVRKVQLYCDGKEIFSSDISSVDFAQTRMINSLVDFNYWYDKKSFYMKSFIEPGNKLPIYKSIDNGYIDINEEKNYKLRYELEDLYGNSTSYTFNIKGEKREIPNAKICSQKMLWNDDNYYSADLFSLTIPKGNLYDDLCFTLNRTSTSKYMSATYEVNNRFVPLDVYGNMTIKLTRDTLPNKAQYGIVRIAKGHESWVGGTYSNGAMTTRVRELGNTYAVSIDTQAPAITPVLPAKWVAQREIRIRLTDNKSGIASYRGTIDGTYALFEHDVKSSVYIYRFDSKRLKKDQVHNLIFTAVDGCGNTSTYEYEFKTP